MLVLIDIAVRQDGGAEVVAVSLRGTWTTAHCTHVAATSKPPGVVVYIYIKELLLYSNV